MKKLTKVTAVILAVVMTALCFSAAAFAVDFRDVRSTVPEILIRGQGTPILSADETQEYYPVNLPEGKIGEITNECLPLFKDAVVSGDYSEWSDKLVGAIADIYKELQLDGDGNPQYGTHVIETQWTDAELAQRASWYAGAYNGSSFQLQADWRLDPYEIAAQIKHRIDVVKASTGAQKVRLVARCEGVAFLLAYLKLYGVEDVESMVLYSCPANGLEAVSGAFSGKFSIDADALVEFYENQDLFAIEDSVISGVINNTIAFMQDIYGLDIACALLGPVVPKLYREAVYKCVLNSYGTFPGIWTLVSPEDYETAKAGVFAGVEEEYAGLIAKLDRYHNEIGLHYKEILKDAESEGVKIAVIAKYGDYLMKPVCEDNYAINDAAVSLSNSSFGATTAKRGEVFTDAYLAKAKKNGTDKYISPDKMVDASTCLFPDTTWFISDNSHSQFLEVTEDFINIWFNTNGEMTVFTDENYPQFLHADVANPGDEHCFTGSLTPLTEENCMQPDEKESLSPAKQRESFKEKLFAFLKSIFTLIIRLFNRYEKTGSLL